MTLRAIPILLVYALLATSTGCQMLGIPSYRADSGGLGHHLDAHLAEHSPAQMVCDGNSCYEVVMDESGGMGAPRVLPPLPGWLGRWHTKKDLPEAPEYPRFQPLPTRPMFSPAPGSAESAIGYGDLPATESW